MSTQQQRAPGVAVRALTKPERNIFTLTQRRMTAGASIKTLISSVPNLAETHTITDR